jgi:hypothetical protein
MLETNQTATQSDDVQAATAGLDKSDEVLMNKMKSFIGDCFPAVKFAVLGLDEKYDLDYLAVYASRFPEEVEGEFRSIEGINIMYQETSAWDVNSHILVATKGEFLMVATYEFCDIDNIARMTIELFTGNSLEISSTTSKVVQGLLSDKLKSDAQSLLHLILRNSSAVTSETLNAFSSGFELSVDKLNLEAAAHNLMLVGLVASDIKQANIANQIKMVDKLAPNISHVTFEVIHENDFSGEHYQSINTYTVHLVDGTKVEIGYEEYWNDDFISDLVGYNEDIFPDHLKVLAEDAVTDDEAVMDELTKFVMTLFGGSSAEEFWFVTNRLDSLIWDAASNHYSFVNFANYKPAEDDQS